MKKLLIVSIFASLSSLMAQTAPEGVEINVIDNEDFNGFEMLEKSLAGRRVFMTGENHSYTDFNARLEIKMLRYLNAKAGVKNFIIELGAARAQYLNRFINAEDTVAESMLKATTSPKYMKLFKRLRKWNLTLPQDQRIHVYGIDVERFNDLPLMHLSELLPKDKIPADIRSGVDAVHNAAGWLLKKGLEEYEGMLAVEKSGWGSSYKRQPFYIGPTIKQFIRYYDSLRPSFQKWLGKDFERANEAVNWLKEYRQWLSYDNTSFQYVWREESMYHKMTNILDSLPKEKFFGQFGRCHTAYTEQQGDCGWYGYHSVINKLKSRYFANDTSVLTIGIFYDRFYETGSTLTGDKEKLDDEIKSLVKKTKSNTTTLFNLTGDEAELPLLAKKFTYAIVSNDFESLDSDTTLCDSVTSDTTTIYDNEDRGFAVYYFGINRTQINLVPLSEHLAVNGITALTASENKVYTLGTYFQYGKAYAGYGATFMGRTTILDSDTDKYQFGMGTFQLEFGYVPVSNRFIQTMIGPKVFYGRQALRYFKQSDNLFGSGDFERMAVNNSLGVGLDFRLQLNITKWLQLGSIAGYQADLSKGLWRIKSSGSPYAEGALKSNMSGFSYGLNLLLKIPLD